MAAMASNSTLGVVQHDRRPHSLKVQGLLPIVITKSPIDPTAGAQASEYQERGCHL